MTMEQEIAQIAASWNSPRFDGVTRPYGPEDVRRLAHGLRMVGALAASAGLCPPGTVVTPWTESIKTRTLDRHIEQSKISDFILGGKRISPGCSGGNGAILPMASS